MVLASGQNLLHLNLMCFDFLTNLKRVSIILQSVNIKFVFNDQWSPRSHTQSKHKFSRTSQGARA